MKAPLLSVVATSRNDDHGGNLGARTQLFIDGLAEQAERFAFPIELLLVEWNPPADRPPLREALRWKDSEHFQPEVITVPHKVHATLSNSERLPLYQMIAKNVGIRRARGPYVLATNIDILLTDELFAFFQTGLQPNAMYRVDRHDVVARLDGPTIPTPAECRALTPIREHRPDGLHDGDGASRRAPRRSVRPADLPRLALGAWYRMMLPRLHTSGCGDFTLTSSEVWSMIRGYPEWPIFSWHIDGVVLYQAYALGVEMINLQPPMVALHLEHGAGSGWTPEGAGELFSRLDAAGVPYMSTNRYRRLARKLVREGRTAQPINGPDWGLPSASLPISGFEPRQVG
ncbi:MAG TPA: hypothetical protein VLK30_00480 [Candidatus Limnocylindrales bacterium]|nr:hypothetical protein [Candidatus Limnocylindrales bacterium]